MQEVFISYITSDQLEGLTVLQNLARPKGQRRVFYRNIGAEDMCYLIQYYHLSKEESSVETM